MAKYKVGDKVRIVSERPASHRFVDSMVQYLGKTLTVSKVEEETLGAIYRFKEATYPASVSSIFMDIFLPKANGMWAFCEDWISGMAEEPKEQKEAPSEPISVHIRFCGALTVAELMKDGKTVKVANARCNPKDTYDRGEGAKVAVNRLFEKKQKDSTGNQSGVLGKKFRVIGRNTDTMHCFRIGTVVRVTGVSKSGDYLCEAVSHGYGFIRQYINPKDLEPYKEAKK